MHGRAKLSSPTALFNGRVVASWTTLLAGYAVLYSLAFEYGPKGGSFAPVAKQVKPCYDWLWCSNSHCSAATWRQCRLSDAAKGCGSVRIQSWPLLLWPSRLVCCGACRLKCSFGGDRRAGVSRSPVRPGHLRLVRRSCAHSLQPVDVCALDK